MPTVNDTLNELKDRVEAQRARGRRVWAGGNPRFDERKPGRPPAQSRKPCAGGNPHFDERSGGASRSEAPQPKPR